MFNVNKSLPNLYFDAIQKIKKIYRLANTTCQESTD